MHEAKLVRFLQEKILNRSRANRKKSHNDNDKNDNNDNKNNDDGLGDDAELDLTGSLSYNSVRGFKTALIDLWAHQSARRQNPHPHPNGTALKALLTNKQRNQAAIKKAFYENRGKGTIADGYDTNGLRRILDEFWAKSHSTKTCSVGGFLRGRLDFILSHQLLARGEAHCGKSVIFYLPDV